MRIYKHKMINKTEFVPVYVDGSYEKVVSKSKPDYEAWVSAGNVPEVIAYVEPKIEEKRLYATLQAKLAAKDAYIKKFNESAEKIDFDKQKNLIDNMSVAQLDEYIGAR